MELKSYQKKVIADLTRYLELLNETKNDLSLIHILNALDVPLIPGQQRFQGFQIIAPNDHVFAAVVLVVLPVFIKAVLALQHRCV